ncbi:MAG: methylenetetrahydrofolate--tRNA-(uracil(54)-C(5))-methyltransferase (FADH(2)-oxidizing) TrmFO [Clostridia bacterium]|nr:methylenetetrahydrofolate--tRNA-(uracil(54)-C(5))-methyltransferase (FADH(2)-oxidizing) TrmFO [Clostridia bacterium]
MEVKVIGGGLAGCECAYQIAKRGIKVKLFEMKPLKRSDAHHSDALAEVVCSNSFKGNELTNACGLLKEELRTLDSLLIGCADKNRVDAGNALAVDREAFSKAVTDEIRRNPYIEVVCDVVSDIGDGFTAVCTGPLTDDALIPAMKAHTGEFLYFFDAAAPIVTADSIDYDKAFFMNRYNKGTPDYLNCPMDKEEYFTFLDALLNAQTAPVKDFEKKAVFESCMPVEIMAARGADTLRFGPLKPVGLDTDKKHYAVLQLRREKTGGELYNLVGFQTHLTFPEQKRVFSLIPALKNAEFVRYGVMHKNVFINAPELLDDSFALKSQPNVYFCGQISGVEGYVESIASGLVAGIDIARRLTGKNSVAFPTNCVIGALADYISHAEGAHFQPMNANFGLLPYLDCRDKIKKKELLAQRSLENLKHFIQSNEIL